MSREYWRWKGLSRKEVGNGEDDGEGVGLTNQRMRELYANLLYCIKIHEKENTT